MSIKERAEGMRFYFPLEFMNFLSFDVLERGVNLFYYIYIRQAFPS